MYAEPRFGAAGDKDPMKAIDHFHVGIVVDDFDGTRAELSDLFGYEWCQEFRAPIPVRFPTGDTTVEMRFTYSMTAPHIEVIACIPGTVWVPASGSGIHHVGYWSDDVGADAAALTRQGYEMEAIGPNPDGGAMWGSYRSAGGPRVELVDRKLAPMLELLWATRST